MAVPSLVTVGSLALVVAAGAGLVNPAADAVRAAIDGPPQHSGRAENPANRAAAGAVSTAPTRTLHPRAQRRSHPDATPPVLVEVFNNSGITGLAAQRAAGLQAAGWNVAATGNWYGTIPANTVYYPPQLLPQARRLAHALGIQRLQPAVAPMQFDRLTVIFTAG